MTQAAHARKLVDVLEGRGAVAAGSGSRIGKAIATVLSSRRTHRMAGQGIGATGGA